jgi:hypothetical protein
MDKEEDMRLLASNGGFGVNPMLREGERTKKNNEKLVEKSA